MFYKWFILLALSLQFVAYKKLWVKYRPRNENKQWEWTLLNFATALPYCKKNHAFVCNFITKKLQFSGNDIDKAFQYYTLSHKNFNLLQYNYIILLSFVCL